MHEVLADCKNLCPGLHFSEDLSILARKVDLGIFEIPNSIAYHPMEGCDGNEDGSPGELTLKRYDRFSRGGAGILWFEAVSVVKEGRAFPRQLWINNSNYGSFRSLLNNYTKNAKTEFGNDFNPLYIMQLTHSGRFSKPEGQPRPVIAYRNPHMENRFKNENISHLITDDELEELEDTFVNAALLAKEAGFHGVDIKACHGYLNSELLSAFTRPGKYGETFEGRTRFLVNIFDKIKSRLGPEFIVTTRLNLYDGIPYPYGWGVDKEDCSVYDLSDPLKLIGLLYEKGMRLISITMGSPYINPHVNRPYDKGAYIPDEHPLEGISRLVTGTGAIQKAYPGLKTVGTGYSWLRQFSPYLAAGCIENGLVSIVGYGRESIAYPDFPRDILQSGRLRSEKCCLTCGKCTEIMRAGGTAGCVVRNSAIYGPIYKKISHQA